MLTPTEKIWCNGEFIRWDEAKIHVLSHVVSYGSAVFEGIRCYSTPNGPRLFRVNEHYRRLLDSAKIYRMDGIAFTVADMTAATVELIRVNKLEACYVRPILLRGYKDVGVLGIHNPLDLYIACWEWGKYLGEEALAEGVDVCISSWNRIAPNTLPALAKSAANYMNSQLIRMEAHFNGYAEGIALDTNGYISEGSGENIFVIRDNKILTPPLGNSALPGITRDSILTLAKRLGYEITESMIPREMLYIADEVFFTGTAAEVTPIRSIDKIQIGKGTRGPVTEAMQKAFFGIINGTEPDTLGWLTAI
jgi:branched-chain amino acid aminotransferase